MKRLGALCATLMMLLQPFWVSAQDAFLDVVNADAGKDIVVLSGEAVMLDASKTISPDDASFLWTFGDGSLEYEGQKAIHRYSEPGAYNVTLRVRANDRYTVDQKMVYVYRDRALLIGEDDEDLRSKLALNDIYLELVNDKRNFVELMHSFTHGGFIFVRTMEEALQLSELAGVADFDFSDVTLVVLGKNDKWHSSRFYSLLDAQIDPGKLVFVGRDFMMEDLENGTEMKEERVSLFLLYYLERLLMDAGFSMQVLHFVMGLLLVNVIGLFAKRVIGLKSLDVYMSAFVVMALYFIGFIPGLVMYFVFALLSYFARLGYTRDSHIILPWNILKYVLGLFAIFFMLLFGSMFYSHVTLDFLFFPMVLIAFSADMMTTKTMYRNWVSVFGHLIQEFLFIIVSFVLVSAMPLLYFALVLPEIYLAVLLMIGFWAEKYTGLRLFEFYSFRRYARRQ